MTISRSQMRQQITKGPQKKKFIKKKRIRIVSGNKNAKAKRRQVDSLNLVIYNYIKGVFYD